MSLSFFPLWHLPAKGSYQPSQHRLGASRVNSIWARAVLAPWLLSAGGRCSHLVHEERPGHLVFGDPLLWPVVSATYPQSLGSCDSGLSLPEQASSRWDAGSFRTHTPQERMGCPSQALGDGRDLSDPPPAGPPLLAPSNPITCCTPRKTSTAQTVPDALQPLRGLCWDLSTHPRLG